MNTALQRPTWPLALPLAALALLAMAVPAFGPALQYDTAHLAAEPYRLFTCHFVHWSWNHLAWDLMAFTVLGLLIAARSPVRYLACVAASAVAISTALLWDPAMATYRGLSGIDSALFVLLAMLLLRDRPGYLWRVAILLALGLFVGKSCFEFATGRTLFVQDMGPQVTSVPLAHVVGGAVGLLIAWLPSRPISALTPGIPLSRPAWLGRWGHAAILPQATASQPHPNLIGRARSPV